MYWLEDQQLEGMTFSFTPILILTFFWFAGVLDHMACWCKYWLEQVRKQVEIAAFARYNYILHS